MQLVSNVIINILTALYHPFWYAVFSAVLINFLYLYAYRPVNSGKGLKSAIKGWINEFRTSATFRKLLVLSFFTMMILFSTLLNRYIWSNPLSNVLGNWWIWKSVNGKTVLTTECFENIALMFPFVFMLFWTFGDKILKSVTFGRAVWQGLKTAFIFSFTIEMLQLLLHVGTWQLSDIFYNTLGGIIGGVIYYIYYKIKNRIIDKESNKEI